MNSLFPWFDVSNATNWLIALALAIFLAFGVGCAGEKGKQRVENVDKVLTTLEAHDVEWTGELSGQTHGYVGEELHFTGGTPGWFSIRMRSRDTQPHPPLPTNDTTSSAISGTSK